MKSVSKHKYLKQLLAATLLIGIPVVMIFINGPRAMEGILWESSASEKVSENVSEIEKSDINFGFYDPTNQWERGEPWEFELFYINWLYFDKDSLRERVNQIHASGQYPILTVEPWARDEKPVLEGILSGEYDNIIEGLQYAFKNLTDTIYISWGHEMDQDLTERYSWSAKDPETFVKAYRYFHDKFSGEEYKIKWLWSPVAKGTTHSYWPGNVYVDGVGVPVYSFPAFDNKYYGTIRTFEETFTEKYSLVERYNKPIYIKEFGISSSEDFKQYWMHQAFLNYDKYPLLTGVIFFNAEDTPGVWGEDMDTPDWRISHTMASGFVNWYKTGRGNTP